MLEQTNWEREQSDAVVGTRLAELEAENRELRKHYTLRSGAQSLFHLMLTLDEATIQRSGFEEWRHIGRNQPRVFAVVRRGRRGGHAGGPAADGVALAVVLRDQGQAEAVSTTAISLRFWLSTLDCSQASELRLYVAPQERIVSAGRC